MVFPASGCMHGGRVAIFMDKVERERESGTSSIAGEPTSHPRLRQDRQNIRADSKYSARAGFITARLLSNSRDECHALLLVCLILLRARPGSLRCSSAHGHSAQSSFMLESHTSKAIGFSAESR